MKRPVGSSAGPAERTYRPGVARGIAAVGIATGATAINERAINGRGKK